MTEEQKKLKSEKDKIYRTLNKERIDAQRLEYRKANRERESARSAAWLAANQERVKEYRKAHYLENKEKYAERAAAFYTANVISVKERVRSYRYLNKDKVAQATRTYLVNNKEKISAKRSAWKRENAHKVNSLNSYRKARKLKATPRWADEFVIFEAYELAQVRSRATGTIHHVDHIVPLLNPIVCGLHCEFNLRVIPGKENLTKNNRHWPDMPEEN